MTTQNITPAIRRIHEQVNQLAALLPKTAPAQNPAAQILHEIRQELDNLAQDMLFQDERLDQQLEQLITLHNISTQISNTLNLDALLTEAAQFSAKLAGADVCVIRLKTNGSADFSIKSTYSLPETSPQSISHLQNSAIAGHLATNSQPLLINHFPGHPLADPDGQSVDVPPQAVLAVPLMQQGQVTGAIEAYSYANPAAFDENDRYVLSLLATQTSAAINNSQLFTQAQNNYRFLQTILEHIPDAIFIKDKNHTLIEMNQANAEIVGMPIAELIGKTDYDLFPPELADKFISRDDDVFAANTLYVAEDTTTWADSQEHTAYTRLVPMPDSSGQPAYLLGITHDVTERKAREREREQMLAETKALYQGSQAVAHALSEQQIYLAFFEQLQQHHPCEIAAFHFHLVKDEPIWAELKSNWHKNNQPSYPAKARLFLPDAPLRRIFTSRDPLFFDNIAADTRLSAAERAAFAPSGACSTAILPLAGAGQQYGVTVVYFTRPITFNETIKRLWLALTDQVGVSLINQEFIQKSAYRAVQMDTAAQVARAASSILDLQELLNTAVDLICERFNLYYTGVFLVDEAGQWAVLRAGVGEAGRQQIEAGHRLKVGGESMIGWAIANRQPRIALDVGKDAVHFHNPHLPHTRSEMALPMTHQNKVIGALTIQSTEQAAFSQEDIIFLQIIADQLAVTIDNARLFTHVKTNEAKYRELVENANSVIFRMNTRGEVTFFNEFAQKFFGYSETEILGKNILDTIVPKTDTSGHSLAEMINNLIAHPDEYAANINQNVCSNGRRVWVSWANKAVRDDTGQVMEILCVGNDITERIRAEQAQKEALEQAQIQSNISEALATLTDEQAVFETILGEYLYLLRLEQGGIMLLDSTRSQNRLVAQYVDNRVTPANLVFPVAEDRLAQYLIENPFPLVIDDVGTHPLTGHNQARRGPVGSMLLVPIILGGKVIGLIGADAPDKGHVFSPDNIQVGKAIADQLTIWLENRQLAEQTRYHATLLKIGADVSRAASSILDVDRLIETSVNLIRNRFDFYYVGLFLVDEANEWAVLRAGTGQAGQKQIEANHRLKVGGSSMIGWAVVNRQARIALDVGQEAVHFQNPYLPDTRSEMALPLISRDQAIGALTVQSVARSAFSTEDITALQTMADQLANAITNARLYEASRRATRREALIKEITAKVRANTDITGILQTTITEIGAAVGGQRAYIYLTPPPNNNE